LKHASNPGNGAGSDRPDGAIHYHTCCLCEALCGLELTVRDGKVTRLRGDPDDVLSRGHLCPKAAALPDLHEDPDRLRQPMRRSGTEWEPVTWEDAIDEAASRLHAIREAHGRDAVAFYLGNPAAHHHATLLAYQLFAMAVPTRNRYSATSTDQLPHMFAALLMFGHQLLLPVPDVDRTDLFVVFGGNPVVSNGSIMTAPDVEGRLKDLRRRGGQLWVFDPRRTETAELADRHVFVRPGTDALVLLALLNTIFEEGLVPAEASRLPWTGLDALEAAARRFPPERVAEATGVGTATIRELARQLAVTPKAAVYGRVGLCTQAFGGLSAWLVYAVNAVTGHLDRAGGLMLAQPAVDIVGLATRLRQQGHFDKRRSRVRGLPEFGGEYPVAALAEEIETAGPGQVRGLVTVAGNPVLSIPNGARLDAALGTLDFMVSLDPFINETTRHAHLILPPPSPLERDHFGAAFHMLAVRNTIKYNPPVFEPPDSTREDWDTLLELGARLGSADGSWRSWRASVAARVARRLGLRRLVEWGLRAGPYGAGFVPFRRRDVLTLARLEQNPHGLDLGPLEPSLAGRLCTPDRRVHLAPERCLADLERLERLLEPPQPPAVSQAPDGALQLIGRRQLRSNNSWLHNSARLMKGKNRCTLLMHPDDAHARGLAAGEHVQVSSRVGSVVAELEVTDAMMPGVVSLPHGWGHARPGVRLSVASRTPGVSLNDLTDETHLDALTGTAAFSGVPVHVSEVAR
jgi:anaerobic selenocysteine-containing dehydrogenase